MMKKNRLGSFIVVFIICLFVGSNCLAAINQNDTLGDLKTQLKALQAKQQQKQNEKKKTQSEIDANKRKMQNAANELEETKANIAELEKQIEITNEDITKVKAESEELLVLYQELDSENIYVSYITGASSMTDLIMRMDVINQLTEYNEQKLDELEMLINNNNKLNKELAKYQVKLNENIVAYEQSIEELGDELADLELGALTIDQEITALQETIKSYEKLGCKDDQLLTACVSVANNSGWLKPISKGRINSLYGYRSRPTANASSYHKGIDIGTAEGTIVRKSSCGGNMVYVWAYVNGKPYTYVFMHLLQISVNVGDTVGVNTQIGLSGGGSTASRNGGYDTCTTGAHLHYGLASGGFYGTKELPLSKFNSNTMNPPGYPGLYQWFYSR